MTITINLPPDTLAGLKAEAQASGKDVDTFVREAIEAKLARRKRALADVVKPIHDAVTASGLSDAEVESLLEQELKAHRAERRSGAAKS
jgi:predicted DNA binding CopG/RHH family protein